MKMTGLVPMVLSAAMSAAAWSQAAQVQPAAAAAAVVPQIVKVTGAAPERERDTVEAVFRIYAKAEGGEALWSETQKVTVDRDGNYSVLLGVATAGGLPPAVFAAGEARWLGVSIERAPEKARVPLVAVPYAMKAADAESVGGIPAGELVTQKQLAEGAADGAVGARSQAAAHGNAKPAVSGITGTIPVWTSGTALGNSILSEKGTAVTVKGTVAATSATTTAAVSGSNAATKGLSTGVLGKVASGTTNSVGVSGVESAAATSGAVYGVSGSAASTAPGTAGVTGTESAKTGIVYGMQGTAASGTSGAAGVFGNETGPIGQVFGVYGKAASNQTNAAGVNGVETATTGQVYGVSGATGSSTSFAAGVNGIEGSATGEVYGVSGSTASTTTNAAGVNGAETAATGQVYGVNGASFSSTTNSAGVNGYAAAATGQVYGVNGASNSNGSFSSGVNGYNGSTTGQVYGVSGQTNSTTSGAAAINGYEPAISGKVYGVSGYTASPAGAGVAGQGAATGVMGTAFNGTGSAYGVWGTTPSTGGIGVYGTATASAGSATGVEGSTQSSGGSGVIGIAQTAGGTAGEFINFAGSGPVLTGLAGQSLTQVFSVDSSGNLSIAGNLTVNGTTDLVGTVTKPSGTFKIDDPLDPAHKYLSHSFVESPDMMNVYNGNVVTDKRGMATVTLPDYFEALNRDFRYQLTVIGQFAQAIVEKEIAKNRFVIRTSKPGVKVSWQVTGIRQDAYANANRTPVEEDKPAGEQGYYLHPEVFGQPASQSVSAAKAKVARAGVAQGQGSSR